MTVNDALQFVEKHADAIVSHARTGCEAARSLIRHYRIGRGLADRIDVHGPLVLREAVEAWKAKHHQ